MTKSSHYDSLKCHFTTWVIQFSVNTVKLLESAPFNPGPTMIALSGYLPHRPYHQPPLLYSEPPKE